MKCEKELALLREDIRKGRKNKKNYARRAGRNAGGFSNAREAYRKRPS